MLLSILCPQHGSAFYHLQEDLLEDCIEQLGDDKDGDTK